MTISATQSMIDTLTYQTRSGWSEKSFPNLDSERTIVLVFGASPYIDKPAPFKELRRHFPRSHFLGCSTAGEISGAALLDDSLSVGVCRFEHTQVATATAPIASRADSMTAGQVLARQLLKPTLRAVFVLSDGLNVNGSELVRGLSHVLPKSVVVTGGLAGDGDRFQRTWVLENATPTTGVVSALGFYGDHIRIGHGSQGGWDVFGPERIVTRSEANVLFELDGKPALPLYKEYLGERAAGLPGTALLFPLSVWSEGSADSKLVRTILGVDEATESIVFAGDIPQGWRARLMRANFDRLIQGAEASALMTRRSEDSGAPCLSIAISCVGRRMVLGERTEEELESVLGVLPSGTKQVGFYSYGELSPFANGACMLQNQTMTLTTIAEI